MKNVATDIKQQSKIFYDQVPQVANDYSWYNLSKKAIDGLIGRVGTDIFNSSKGYLK
jgi:hypothetical protein